MRVYARMQREGGVASGERFDFIRKCDGCALTIQREVVSVGRYAGAPPEWAEGQLRGWTEQGRAENAWYTDYDSAQTAQSAIHRDFCSAARSMRPPCPPTCPPSLFLSPCRILLRRDLKL